MNLVINPFTQFENTPLGEFFLVAPKKIGGLKIIEITQAENENLYEVFTDLAKTRFDFLDVEKDLDDNDREFLLENGVLVEPENIPQKPLFACQLDDVEIVEKQLETSSLFVNPTFRFEPLNIANFATWMQEKHLLPHQNTVWVRSPVTHIETGYWLSASQTEVVKNLAANQKFEAKIDDETFLKLIAAEILVTAEDLESKTTKLKDICETAHRNFAENKYSVMSALLSQPQVKALQTFYRQYVANGFMPFGDPQVPNRFVQHNEPLAKQMHENFKHLTSLVVGKDIIPSYVYAASYKNSADLEPHIDREQCEYSISFQVDYTPENFDNVSPWSLYVEPAGEKNFGWEIVAKEGESDEKRTAVNLANGDGLFYKGRELVHYRYKLAENHTSTSLFFHYVDKDFSGKLH